MQCLQRLFSLVYNCRKNREQCYPRLSAILTTAMFSLVGRIADHSRESLISVEIKAWWQAQTWWQNAPDRKGGGTGGRQHPQYFWRGGGLSPPIFLGLMQIKMVRFEKLNNKASCIKNNCWMLNSLCKYYSWGHGSAFKIKFIKLILF